MWWMIVSRRNEFWTCSWWTLYYYIIWLRCPPRWIWWNIQNPRIIYHMILVLLYYNIHITNFFSSIRWHYTNVAGNLNQPKYGHLKQLHSHLMSMEKILTHGESTNKDYGNWMSVSKLNSHHLFQNLHIYSFDMINTH